MNIWVFLFVLMAAAARFHEGQSPLWWDGLYLLLAILAIWTSGPKPTPDQGASTHA